MADLPLVQLASAHGSRIALVTEEGDFTYRQLLEASADIAHALLGGNEDLREERVAFLTPPGFHYVATLWGIWRAGGVAVPLCTSHPRPELEYVIADSAASVVVAHPDFEETLRPIVGPSLRCASGTCLSTAVLLKQTGQASDARRPPGPTIAGQRRALIVYTSGTTSKPKGVVTTHGNLRAQIESLVEAWEWSRGDRILHVLPLHHVHGIVNALLCALWSGAVCEMLPRFDAVETWSRIQRGHLTLFMAVPTIYARLIAAWEAADEERRRAWSAAASQLRLMVSGSAALPVGVLDKWKQITGHVLLERYGTSETAMALSNPLLGERRAGFVGTPLPGVHVRLRDDDGTPVAPGTPGEIHIKGENVFLEYWRQPEATRLAFREGWYRTGDVAVIEHGSYRILGRSSVDIIKTGGYKVSALEIEEVLREHPDITECAVVGLADEEWGERVGAAVVTVDRTDRRDEEPLALADLRDWARARLAPEKLPTRLLVVRKLPRNTMGKVVKPEVVRMFLKRET